MIGPILLPPLRIRCCVAHPLPFRCDCGLARLILVGTARCGPRPAAIETSPAFSFETAPDTWESTCLQTTQSN
jgi:hypothetical protein